MTPEQLEEVPGIGPKTVEKISIAVNNYFSSLDAAALPDAGEEPGLDVSAEEEARELAAEEAASADVEAGESPSEVEDAERDDEGVEVEGEEAAESDVLL